MSNMERLTERTDYGICGNNATVKNYPLYKVALEDPLDHGIVGLCFEKLAYYEDLAEQGRLIELRPIKGFENYYSVDIFGNVYGTFEENSNGRRLLKRKPTIASNGYEYITLKANGIVKNARVHKLVAEAFLPNPNNYPVINHIDGDKSNNCVWNLEWCSRSHNTKHAIDNSLMSPPTNLKDGVYVNGKNKFAVITNTMTGDIKIFNSFGKAT